MRTRRFALRAVMSVVLMLSQGSFALAQESGPPPDESTDQTPADQAPPSMAPPDEAAQDQAPAPVGDDVHWWLKRGGSGSGDFATIIPLQVEYKRFWQWRSGALEQLDIWFLEEVMFGDALAREEAILQGFRAQGKAQVVVVENHPQIWYATPGEAVIYDPYVSRSYFVDLKTRAPLGDGPNTAPTTASVAYHLTKHAEQSFGRVVWMVDAIVGINLE